MVALRAHVGAGPSAATIMWLQRNTMFPEMSEEWVWNSILDHIRWVVSLPYETCLEHTVHSVPTHTALYHIDTEKIRLCKQ